MKLFEDQDIAFMHLALDAAKLGEFSAHPNPRVGCVIVKEGSVISSGLHWQTGSHHAEINALQGIDAKGATVYVNLEPCSHVGKTPACTDALIKAKVARVVVGCVDPNPYVAGKGVQALINAGIAVTVGVLEDEALELNKGFFKRMKKHMPYVRVKIGMSLDAKVAMQSGESKWITSAESRQHVQQWRARSGAILTSSQTVLADDCRCNVRDIASLGLKDETLFRQPLRVVVDSDAKVPLNKAIFQQEGKTLIATCKQGYHAPQDNIDTIVLPSKNNKVDLKSLLEYLAKQEINDVLVEAGPTLVGALLQEELVDELLLYIAPKLLGNEARSLAALPGMTKLSEHIAGFFSHAEKINEDLFVVMTLNENELKP